jgi:hypothetical protein
MLGRRQRLHPALRRPHQDSRRVSRPHPARRDRDHRGGQLGRRAGRRKGGVSVKCVLSANRTKRGPHAQTSVPAFWFGHRSIRQRVMPPFERASATSAKHPLSPKWRCPVKSQIRFDPQRPNHCWVQVRSWTRARPCQTAQDFDELASLYGKFPCGFANVK